MPRFCVADGTHIEAVVVCGAARIPRTTFAGGREVPRVKDTG